MKLVMDIDLTGKWRAAWAWSAERGGPGLAVRRFRTAFELAGVPGEFLVHVSADSRYRFFVNGRRAGRGPLKGTLERYHYETYDIAEALQPGRNVLAAEVHFYGLNAPNSEVHSGYAGFLLEGPQGAGIDTPGGWKVDVDRAIQPDTTSYIANAQDFLNHTERVDGRLCPRGWEGTDFDDTAWQDAVFVAPADVNRSWGETHPVWELAPREIPMLVEEPCRFARTIVDMRPAEHLFGVRPRGWTLPAGQGGEIVLDAAHLTTGYPELHFRGGAGREVQVIYGECIGRWGGDRERRRDKGVRDDLSFGDVDGYRDTLTLPGGEFRYEPLHWRTFWFVRVAVSAGEGPFELADFTYRFTTYPQRLLAQYASSAPDSARMMEVSWRTLQLCSHETYEDCPYYEQLNYIYDSRNEALQSLALAGETALPKRTIRLFRDSLRPDGLVHARVPSRRKLRLPYFALFYVMMVEDYWRWTGDAEFVRENLFAVDGVLSWFRQYLREDGFVGHVPYWSPSAGGLTNQTCEYLCAIQAAMRLHAEAGHPGDGRRWRPWADHIHRAVRERAWSEELGLFLPSAGATDEAPNQSSQVFAILAGVPAPDQQSRIVEQLMTYPFRGRMNKPSAFYLARVLEQCGLYAEFERSILQDYRQMLARHVSTWQEGGEPGRSDCHAWTGWIAHDFLTAILGIRPLKPGFAEVLLRPQPIYEFARGSMPTVRGTVRVEWRHEGGRVVLEGEVPAGVPARVELPGTRAKRFPQGGAVRATSGPLAAPALLDRRPEAGQG